MSEKQPKTCIMISIFCDTLQRIVGCAAATWFRSGGTSDQYFITNLLPNLCWKTVFNIAQHVANIWGKVDCLKRPVRRCNVLLKDEELAW